MPQPKYPAAPDPWNWEPASRFARDLVIAVVAGGFVWLAMHALDAELLWRWVR